MDIVGRLISTLINGSLEELFIITFVIILLERSDFISKKNWKKNLVKIILIYILPMCILSVIIDYILYLQDIQAGIIRTIIKQCIGTIITAIVVMGLVNIKSIKDIVKIVLFSIVSFSTSWILEILTVVFMMDCAELNLDYIVSNTGLLFIMTIPERIVQYGIILFFYIKKNSFVQVNVYKLILENKILKNIFIVTSVFDIVLFLFMVRYVFVLKVLESLSVGMQLSIIVSAFSLIITNMILLWIIAICIYPKEKYLQKFSK